MKKFRIKILILAALFAVSSFGLAGILSAKAEYAHSVAYNATVQQFENLDFHMDGASVRTKAYPGIRFEASLNKEQWDIVFGNRSDDLSNDGNYKIDGTGLVMVPSDYLQEGGELTVETGGAILLPLNLAEKGDVYKLRGGISPIDSELYGKKFTARGYIQYTVKDTETNEKGETKQGEYINFRYAVTTAAGGTDDMSSRSLNEVIAAALGDEGSGLSDDAKTFVQSIQNRTPHVPTKILYNVNETIDLGALNSEATNFYVSVKSGAYEKLTESSYTFLESGRHKFRLQEASGTSDSFTVDAISPETKYDVFKAENLLATLKYGGKPAAQWNSLNNNTQKIEEADPDGDGVSETMFTYSPDHAAGVDGTVIVGKPVYSKEYYQKLSTDSNQIGVTLNLDFSYYFTKNNNTTDNFTEYNTFTKHDGVYYSYSNDTTYVDHWVTETITLDQFISLYDNLYKGYVWENNGVRSKLITRDTVTADEDIDYLMNFYHDNGFDLYIRDMKLNVPAADLGTVLVDRHTLTEVDLSGNTKLNIAKELYDIPELTLVSRYGNNTIPFADNKFTITDDMEDGLYYLKGTKDGEDCFTLTVDIYDSTKPVEVESFGHTDSKDAVKVYYVRESAYTVSATSYANGSINSMDIVNLDTLNENDCIKLDINTSDHDYGHGLSFKTMSLSDSGEGGKYSSIYGADNLTDVPYLEIDESKFTTEGIDGRLILNKPETDPGNNTSNSSDAADIYIYVLPRHSKEYYESYKRTCDKYAFAYTGGFNNAPAIYGAGQFYGYINGVTNNKIGFVHCNMTWNDGVYTYSAVSHTDNTAYKTTEFTINDFIANYDAFANGSVWSYKLVKASHGKYDAESTWQEVATLKAKMFGVTFTQKEIMPPDDLGTVLVDRHESTVADLSSNESLSEAMASHDNPELKLVSRYGNKEIPFADNKFTIVNDTASTSYMEDGLYYLKGIKDEEECFVLTIDIYDSTKPVEVESFGHSDSKDAVRVYYVRESAYTVATAGQATNNINSMDIVNLDNLNENDCIKLDFDNDAHGLSFKTKKLTDTGEWAKYSPIYGANNLTVPYLAIDESKFTTAGIDGRLTLNKPESAIDCLMNNSSDAADIYIFVLPRHSKAYYESYKKTCDKYAFAYSGGFDNRSGTGEGYFAGQFYGYINEVTADNKIEFINCNQTWDDYVYTYSAVSHTDGNAPLITEFTINDFIANYDAFANGDIWSYKLVKASMGRTYNDQWQEVASLEAKMFSVTFTQKEITPPDDLGTVLVDRHEKTEEDLSSNESLSAAMTSHDNPELKLVSRYGDKEITFADNKFTITDDMENGLYYLKGIKDEEECFRLTIDIYDSTKPVEVESFGHSDSKDAVSVYYIKENSFSVSGEPSARTYNTQAMFDFGSMSSDNYVKLDFDNSSHGLSLGTETLEDRAADGVKHSSVYGPDHLADVPCLMIDQSKFTKDSPMPVDNNEAKCWFTGKGADLYIYVLPRHSKEYYELYRNTCDKYAFSYTGGYNNAWYTATPAPDNTWYSGQYFGYVSGITEDNQISFVNSNMTWYDWAYTDAVIQNGEHPVTNLTIDEFISHYDAFAEGKVWSYRLVKATLNPKEGDRVMGECATYTAKMFGITFTQKEPATPPTPPAE